MVNEDTTFGEDANKVAGCARKNCGDDDSPEVERSLDLLPTNTMNLFSPVLVIARKYFSTQAPWLAGVTSMLATVFVKCGDNVLRCPRVMLLPLP